MLRLILNIIWLVTTGLALCLSYLLAGVIACLFIVTIPAGVACFRLAGYVLWPFGRRVVEDPNAGGWSAVSNVIWFVVAGMWLALAHVGTAVASALTIIGIPLAIANIKLIPITCFPFGKKVVSADSVHAQPPAGVLS